MLFPHGVFLKCQILHPVLATFVSQSLTEEACRGCHVTGAQIREKKLRICGCLARQGEGLDPVPKAAVTAHPDSP